MFPMRVNLFKRPVLLGLASLALVGAGGAVVATADSGPGSDGDVTVWVPRSGDVAGVETRGFVVDLSVRINGNLAQTGSSLELTGPGAHQNIAPLPGNVGTGANADHFPGLVVLLSSTKIGAGAGQNLANEFNITGITDRPSANETEVWATWIIGAKGAFASLRDAAHPQPTEHSNLFVTAVKGTAPDVVTDANGDGRLDEKDLQQMGYDVIASPRKVSFEINRQP
ncbi:MAG TPA: hypothetical protein VKD47_06110 [Miltoncostaeaceae bacterium]|nr:hypothetical protein [Miltoncostaeaceae bacterium]